MSENLQHECGVAALYWLDQPVNTGERVSRMVTEENVLPLMTRLLLDLQNRGQLAAGISSYKPGRDQLIDTFKAIGQVTEALRMSHAGKHKALVQEYAGKAVIGHTRYATCGADDARYAQPFERHHGRLWKWYSFAFNGTLSNYDQLRNQLLSKKDYHFTMNNDTEVIMHTLSYSLRGDSPPDLQQVMSDLAEEFDGAYNLVFLDAMGRMFVSRDPLGIRPMSWAVRGKLFAAASESVALRNLGFDNIQSLAPGEMLIIENGKLRHEHFSASDKRARCFFEWIYFANVGSEIDGIGVYDVRAATGKRLAAIEEQIIDEQCIAVPVPDTAKAAADAFAYNLSIPCVEGIIRNRYMGRTFIQTDALRAQSVSSKYTVLPSVLSGKRVFLLEDSIVRSTTLRALAEQIRQIGNAREVHVRVACPPIIAPCFYGIDMSTLGELFAPQFIPDTQESPGRQVFSRMAETLGVSSVRYLSVEDLVECLSIEADTLCLGCVTGEYPTPFGQELIRKARRNYADGFSGRTYE